MKKIANFFAGMTLALVLAACSQQAADEPAAAAAPTETADEFIARVNEEYKELLREGGAAGWVRGSYITEDTAILASLARERASAWHSNTVKEAMQYDDQELSPATRRAIDRLKLGTTLPAPNDPDKRRELSQIATELEGMYGAGKYCRNEDDCISGTELEGLMQTSRDYDELLEYWQGWRAISPPMRDKYERYVELANEGAAELGYNDLGDMWRSGYDMSAAEFREDTSRLWA